VTRQLIAGNWKMNLDRARAVELASAVASGSKRVQDVDLLVCPPSPYLLAVAEAIAGSTVALGAQNMYHEPEGAYTGEVSPSMLRDCGCRYVIVGHSERRHILGESDRLVGDKVRAAVQHKLIPVLCVGELLAEREAGRTEEIVRRQLEAGLADLNAGQVAEVVVAYEPVWAIGTGRVATPETAQHVHAELRNAICERYNQACGESVRILYGGSVNAGNAAKLLAQKDIDGVLVGGASLSADGFLTIAAAGRQGT
jgi:triosephosphate isomerase